MTSTLRGAPRELGAGIRHALDGLGTWLRAPRLMALGAVPALLTAVLFAAALVAVLANLSRIGRGLADMVTGGDGVLADLVAVTAALAVLAASALVAVASYTTVTLLVGQPFFEAISRDVDARAGGLEAVPADEGFWRGTLRGVGEGLLTVTISLAVSVVLLLVGLVPAVGSAAAFTVGALVGGRLLAIELTAYPLARRGIVSRRDRVAALRPVRLRVVGFGTVAFLAFLIPFGAVLAMPAVVAGATLLARDADAARDAQ